MALAIPSVPTASVSEGRRAQSSRQNAQLVTGAVDQVRLRRLMQRRRELLRAAPGEHDPATAERIARIDTEIDRIKGVTEEDKLKRRQMRAATRRAEAEADISEDDRERFRNKETRARETHERQGTAHDAAMDESRARIKQLGYETDAAELQVDQLKDQLATSEDGKAVLAVIEDAEDMALAIPALIQVGDLDRAKDIVEMLSTLRQSAALMMA